MTGSRANSSKERILATAEHIILQRGFAGTTIEDIVDRAAITKSGFFYHFQGKKELARALIDRYIKVDTDVFITLSDRADTLSEDPLQQTLIFLNLFGEMVAGMTEVHPGCLAAAFTYESQQFDPETRERIRDGMMTWREIIEKRLNAIIENYPPRISTNVQALADMFTSSVEGGIILAMSTQNNDLLIEQVQNYRNHLRLLFGDI